MEQQKKTLNVFKYFIESDEEHVKCTKCFRILKNDRVFNLRKHLRLHDIQVENEANNSVSAASKNIKNSTIKVQINKKTLIRSYIGLVTEESVPFHVLNSNNMRNIIDPICRGIGEKYGSNFKLNGNKCKTVLKNVVANIRHSATRLGRNIFGLSAQYITKNEIKSRILAMVELKGTEASTSKNLAKEILSVLENYEISLSQIVSITSDNGANIIKTSKILSQMYKSDDDFDEACTEQKNMEYTKQIDHFENTENIYVGDLQICRCAAHTAQLCALDVTKHPSVKNFLFQCRNLTKYIHKPSNGYRDLFELLNFKLPQLDCPTRWGSTFNIIDDLNKAKSILSLIETVENKTEDENFEANDFLWDFIDCYVTVMAPLQKTIVQFQEEQLHYGNFYALWLTCKLTTNQILTTNAFNKDSIIYIIGNKLIQSMETRSKKLVSNVGFDACLYLDPRFHHIIDSSQKERAINFLKTLWDQLKVHGQIPNSNRSSNSSNTDPGNLNDNGMELLDNFLSNSMILPHESTYVHGKIEGLKLPFLKSNVNVLNFWRNKKSSDPELYALSKVCFAIPPTQVTIERAFSSMKLVLSDNQNRLSHETLENILLVKLNSTHLDSAIDNLSLFENDN